MGLPCMNEIIVRIHSNISPPTYSMEELDEEYTAAMKRVSLLVILISSLNLSFSTSTSGLIGGLINFKFQRMFRTFNF